MATDCSLEVRKQAVPVNAKAQVPRQAEGPAFWWPPDMGKAQKVCLCRDLGSSSVKHGLRQGH